MLLVIALGGNALLQRGEPLEAHLQKANIALTAQAIAQLAKDHQIVICHGNGPQVGLLALQNEAYTAVKPYPLDVLGAQTQGMVGYLVQHELGNALPNKQIVTLLTQVVVDKDDPAFKDPSKPIGPVYTKEQADQVAAERKWHMAPDNHYFRRVVPSPKPQDVIELPVIKQLVEQGTIVICGGGGGIPVIRTADNKLEGIEAVIDKDTTASIIAEKLGADMLLILTDVGAVCTDFGTPQEKKIKAISSKKLQEMSFARGSMGPKITASCKFVEHTNKTAAIGKLSDVKAILNGNAGTKIHTVTSDVLFY